MTAAGREVQPMASSSGGHDLRQGSRRGGVPRFTMNPGGEAGRTRAAGRQMKNWLTVRLAGSSHADSSSDAAKGVRLPGKVGGRQRGTTGQSRDSEGWQWASRRSSPAVSGGCGWCAPRLPLWRRRRSATSSGGGGRSSVLAFNVQRQRGIGGHVGASAVQAEPAQTTPAPSLSSRSSCDVRR